LSNFHVKDVSRTTLSQHLSPFVDHPYAYSADRTP
jgi:hypothetical protein